MTSLATPQGTAVQHIVPELIENNLMAVVFENRDAVFPDLFLSDPTERELYLGLCSP